MPLSTSFDFDLTGIEGYERRLRRIADRANDKRTIFRELIRIFKRSEARIFASEGQALGRRWAPLSPAYAARKVRQYPGRSILVATGELRASLVDHPTVRFRGDTMTIGSSDRKSSWHQEGVPQNGLPRRRHVGLTIGDRQAWKGFAARHIASGRT